MKLSERFYQKLGHEMVNWFNQVDATYRSDLRDVNELNFSRFDAKLEQRHFATTAGLMFAMGHFLRS